MNDVCDCLYHRFHVVHICACGKIIPHSQASWDDHRFHGGMEDFSSRLYTHGDTPDELRRKARNKMNDVCPECGKEYLKVRAYNNGDKNYIHKETLKKYPFPHYEVIESCYVPTEVTK